MHLKYVIEFFSGNGMVDVEVTVVEILRVEILKKWLIQPNPVFSRIDILVMLVQIPIIHSFF